MEPLSNHVKDPNTNRYTLRRFLRSPSVSRRNHDTFTIMQPYTFSMYHLETPRTASVCCPYGGQQLTDREKEPKGVVSFRLD